MKSIIDYIVALTNLYGIVHKRKVLDIYNEQNEEAIYVEQINMVMDEHQEQLISHHTYIYDDYFVHEAIFVFDEFNQEIQKKQGKPYYIPPKNELLKYTDQFYIEKNKQYKALLRYMTKHIFSGKRVRANELCEETYSMLQSEYSIQQILSEYNQIGIVFDDEQQVKEVVHLVIELSNNTRLWSNNGYTPDELSEFKQPLLGKTPNTNDRINSSGANLTAVPSRENKKIGRNEPCLCGSGKKYKKCCME